MGNINPERENEEQKFGEWNSRTQPDERAKWFRIDASNIYFHAELFALIAVVICGAVELVGHSVFGLKDLETVLLGVTVGLCLAAFSLYRLGGKFFRTSELFSIHMMVLAGYRYRGVTREDVIRWIGWRQHMSR